MALKCLQLKSDDSDTDKKHESVGFIYGGVMKACYAYLFSAPTSHPDEVMAYAKEKFSDCYGDFSGRFVKCRNGEQILEKVLEQAKEYKVFSNSRLLLMNVSNLSALLKDVIEENAPSFKFEVEMEASTEEFEQNSETWNQDQEEDGV